MIDTIYAIKQADIDRAVKALDSYNVKLRVGLWYSAKYDVLVEFTKGGVFVSDVMLGLVNPRTFKKDYTFVGDTYLE